MKHTDDPVCPSCSDKLYFADPVLVSWFKRLKARYPSVHVSWSFRTAAEQDEAFREGKSRLRYPHSKHNAVRDGKPCSLALDLFQIDEDGNARFSAPFYAKVARENEENKESIVWGGSWEQFPDGDHFELKS